MSHVRFENVSVEYPVYDTNVRTIKSAMIGRFRIGGNVMTDQKGVTTVRSLDNITLAFEHGDRVGLIGHNGAGKSTLLRVIAGVYEPARGSVSVQGRVSPIFDLRLGMDDDASGIENILIRGQLLGLTRKEIEGKIPDIVEFSELESYVAMPVRTYSTGMKMRLAFAIATSIEPDILLLDEWISAGDESFLEKVEVRMSEFVGDSNILALASHRLPLVEKFCNKAVLLHRGELKAFGPVDEIIQLRKEEIRK